MYDELHLCLYSRTRRWIRWLILQKLDSIDFVRFQVFCQNKVSIGANDYGSLPPLDAHEYELERTTCRPPILLTALAHYVQKPLDAPKGALHLKRMPKKLGARVSKATDPKGENSAEDLEGWGLHVREVVCWKKVSMAMAVIGFGSLAFAIFWCVKRGGGLQDGFTVAAVLMAQGTIILGLIQAASMKQSRAPTPIKLT
ncbi:MAG: hypothetical protein M1832_003642 [Thelocarpon impressellum]|nr:MAG: hypothetical protein M1832_003642 [Thelocarpon impressellum]